MRKQIFIALLLLGCGTTHGGDAGPAPQDAGIDAAIDASVSTDAGACVPVTCEIACMYGFLRGPDGCEICECAPAPDDSCGAGAECVVARLTTGCCGCYRAHSRADVDANPCLVERGVTPPAGCLPDPEVCATIDCAACEPIVRATCEGGSCVGSDTCAAGDVVFRSTCVAACASHAECVLGADYGSCCGGCQAAPAAWAATDPCFAERQSDSSCRPAPGSCDGLGCASAPTDCAEFGAGAVCMSDGSCREAGAGGACPTGTHDESSVCVPD